MKKILKTFCLVCVLLFSGLTANAERINQQVVLDTSMQEAEDILLNLIALYEGKIELDKVDKEKHIYTVKYNMFKPTAVYAQPATQTNINVNSNSVSNNSNVLNTYTYGGYSCQLKQLKNNKDILITCRKYCIAQDYIYSHYKKYYRELKLNGKQVVPYKKYIKGKYVRNEGV